MELTTFNDFFDFSDESEIKAAIAGIEKLLASYKGLVNFATANRDSVASSLKETNSQIEKNVKALNTLDTTQKGAKETADALGASIANGAIQSKKLESQNKALADQVKKLNQQIKDLEEFKKRATNAGKDNEKQNQKEAKSFVELNKELKEAKKTRDSFIQGSEDFKKAADNVAELQQAVNKYRLDQRRLAREINQPADSLNALRVRLREAQNEFDGLSRAEREAGEQGRILRARIDQLNTEIADQEELTGRTARRVGGYRQEIAKLFAETTKFGGGGVLNTILGGATAGGVAGLVSSLTQLATEGLAAIAEQTKEINKELREAEVLAGDAFGPEGTEAGLATLRALRSEFESLNIFVEDGFGGGFDAVKRVVEDFGETSESALDLFTVAAVQAQSRTGAVVEAINEFGPALQDLGFNASELLGIFATAPQRGINSIDKLANTLNEFNISFARQEFRKELEAAFGGQFTERIFTEFANDGRGALQAISEQVQNTTVRSKELEDFLTKAFKSLGEEGDIDKAIDLFASLGEGADLLGANLTQAQQAQLQFVRSQTQVQARLVELTKEFRGSGKQLQTFGNQLKVLALDALIETVRRVQEGFRIFKETVQAFEPELRAVGSAINEVLQFIFRVEEAIRNLGLEALSRLVDKAKVSFNEFILIGKEFQPIFDAVGDAIKNVVSLFAGILDEAENFDDALRIIAERFGFLGNVIAGFGRGVKLAFDLLTDILTLRPLREALKQSLAIFAGISTGLDLLKGDLANFAEGFADLLRFDVESAKAKFAEGFSDIGQASIDAYNEKIQELTFIPTPEEKPQEFAKAKADAEKFGEEIAGSVAIGAASVPVELKVKVTSDAGSAKDGKLVIFPEVAPVDIAGSVGASGLGALLEQVEDQFRDSQMKINMIRDQLGLTQEQAGVLLEQSLIKRAQLRLQALLTSNEATKQEVIDAENELFDLREKARKREEEATRRAEEEKRAQFFKTFSEAQALANQSFDFVNQLFDNQIQKRQEDLENFQETSERQIELVGDNVQAQELLRAQQAQQEDKLRRESVRAERRKAIFNKGVSIANIGASTAEAVMKAIAISPATFGLPFSAFAAAAGALRIGQVLASNIPSFEKGRGNGALPETLAVVNEGGQEMAQDRNGNISLLTSSIRAKGANGKMGDLVRLKAGTRVFTAGQTEKIIHGLHDSKSAQDKLQIAPVSITVSSEGITEAIRTGYGSINQVNHVTTIDENGFGRYTESRGQKTIWKNSRRKMKRGNE